MNILAVRIIVKRPIMFAITLREAQLGLCEIWTIGQYADAHLS